MFSSDGVVCGSALAEVAVEPEEALEAFEDAGEMCPSCIKAKETSPANDSGMGSANGARKRPVRAVIKAVKAEALRSASKAKARDKLDRRSSPCPSLPVPLTRIDPKISSENIQSFYDTLDVISSKCQPCIPDEAFGTEATVTMETMTNKLGFENHFNRMVIKLTRKEILLEMNSSIMCRIPIDNIDAIGIEDNFELCSLFLSNGSVLGLQKFSAGEELSSFIGRLEHSRMSLGLKRPAMEKMSVFNPGTTFLTVTESVKVEEEKASMVGMRMKQGQLMFNPYDDVLDTPGEPWKMGTFQIKLNALYLTLPSDRLPCRMWALDAEPKPYISYPGDDPRPNSILIRFSSPPSESLYLAANSTEEAKEWQEALMMATKFRGCESFETNEESSSLRSFDDGPFGLSLTEDYKIRIFKFYGRRISLVSALDVGHVLDAEVEGHKMIRIRSRLGPVWRIRFTTRAKSSLFLACLRRQLHVVYRVQETV